MCVRVNFGGLRMRISGLAIGLAALLTAGSAQAAVIFDNITGQTAGGTFSLATGNNGSPFGDSFSVSGSAIMNSVSVSLADNSNTDGGSVSVYLVPDASGIPSSTNRVLNGKVLLGTILDSSLVSTASIKTLSTSIALTAGRYWIELVNSSDTANGGSGTVSNAFWTFNNGGAGVGTTGEFYSFANPTNTAFVSSSDSTGPFQMIVTATLPEPATMAILGVGMAGLGLVRRRQRGKSSL